MSFQEVGGAVSYPKYKELESGALVAQGYYTEQLVSKFDKPVYIINEDNGRRVGLNSCGSIDYVFKQLKIGDYVRVIYTGVEKDVKTKFGVKDINTFKVAQDPSKRMAHAPVAEVAAQQLAAPLPPVDDGIEL